MERRIINTLIVNDDDLDCKKDLTLDNISILSLGFVLGDISKFDLIIYIGKLGKKIIKSTYFKGGVIEE